MRMSGPGGRFQRPPFENDRFGGRGGRGGGPRTPRGGFGGGRGGFGGPPQRFGQDDREREPPRGRGDRRDSWGQDNR